MMVEDKNMSGLTSWYEYGYFSTNVYKIILSLITVVIQKKWMFHV